MTYQGPDAKNIQTMFGQIAGNYDRVNTILSAGIHHLWKRRLVRESRAKEGHRVLDCATGTGDLAFRFSKAVGASGEVIGSDFCPEMLSQARKRAAKRGFSIRFEEADAMALPYEDDCFDVVSMAFGIRNIQQPQRAIAEMLRVTKPDGCVVIMEFGQLSAKSLRPFYRFYATKILPWLGGKLSGNEEAYRYLEHSSNRFPSGDEFAKMVYEAAPDAHVKSTPLTGGIAWLYTIRHPLTPSPKV